MLEQNNVPAVNADDDDGEDDDDDGNDNDGILHGSLSGQGPVKTRAWKLSSSQSLSEWAE